MDNFFPGLIMSFREGLEAFLIIMVIIKFLEKSGNNYLKKYVCLGVISSLLLLSVISLALLMLFKSVALLDNISKLWESSASLFAVGLIITFIIWMINHQQNFKHQIENKTALNLTGKGIILLTIFLITREGVEIAIFTIAGQYQIFSIISGIILAAIISFLIYQSLIKVDLKRIFNITLLYLIIQAGYLLGFGIHEGLSALQGLGFLESDHFLLIKVYDFSKTALNHKEGIIGLPLNILFGWYSKPEWMQFVFQYSATLFLLIAWIRRYNTKR